jgi:hypothetical protein
VCLGSDAHVADVTASQVRYSVAGSQTSITLRETKSSSWPYLSLVSCRRQCADASASEHCIDDKSRSTLDYLIFVFRAFTARRVPGFLHRVKLWVDKNISEDVASLSSR